MFAVTGYSSDGFSVVLPGYNFHLTVVCCPVWRSFQVLFKGCFFKISNLCMEQKFIYANRCENLKKRSLLFSHLSEQADDEVG